MTVSPVARFLISIEYRSVLGSGMPENIRGRVRSPRLDPAHRGAGVIVGRRSGDALSDGVASWGGRSEDFYQRRQPSAFHRHFRACEHMKTFGLDGPVLRRRPIRPAGGWAFRGGCTRKVGPARMACWLDFRDLAATTALSGAPETGSVIVACSAARDRCPDPSVTVQRAVSTTWPSAVEPKTEVGQS